MTKQELLERWRERRRDWIRKFCPHGRWLSKEMEQRMITLDTCIRELEEMEESP
jgi:hypothetical protein